MMGNPGGPQGAPQNPFQPGGQQRNARLQRVPDPPAWGPEMSQHGGAHSYSFRDWMQDLVVWGILASELDSGQQCAAVINKLQGGARVIARGLSMVEMTRGGVINGQQVNAVTFLLTQLAASYAPLGEEQRLQAMGDLMQFRRNTNETMDQLIVRFRAVRWKAQQAGNMVMSIEGLSWLLLCAVRPTTQQ